MRIIVFLSLLSGALYAQGIGDEEEISEEEILYNLDIQIDPNTASKKELMEIPDMHREWIKKIISERKKKPFKNYEDFLNRTEIPQEELPFLRYIINIKRKWGEAEWNGFVKYEESDFSYPYRNYNRANLEVGNFSLGLLQEKDIGEKNFLDHYRASFLFKGNKFSVIAGNFVLEKGLGLLYGYPTFFRESILKYRRITPRARSYLSTSENRGLRGGIFISKNIIFFYNNEFYDAKLEDGYITNYELYGLHRTSREDSLKNILKDERVGGIFSFNKGPVFFNIGGDYAETNYPILLEANPEKYFFNLSGDFSLIFSDAEFTAELKTGNSKSIHWAGKLFIPGLKSGFMLYSLNSENFDLHSASITSDNTARDEIGAAFWMRHRIPKGFFYFYTFLFRERTSLKNGEKYFFSILHRFTKKIHTLFEFKRSYAIHQRNRIKGQLSFYSGLRLRLRSDMVWAKDNGKWEIGNLFSIELKKSIFRLRWTLFKTDSYLARVYTYENEMLPSFELLPLYGEGYRFFFDITPAYRFLKFYIKLGTGWETIKGSDLMAMMGLSVSL